MLYYAFLILILPLLRKYISARSCAMLWMIPNYLYLLDNSFLKLDSPKLVLLADHQIIWFLFGIWFAGFVAVLVSQMIAHLRFRSYLLKEVQPVTDEEILALWQEEMEAANLRKRYYPLVVSSHCSTPLSVGLFHRSIRVVLPNIQYNLEELRLIFRHEIVHIGREDAWAKFFLVFCTAMCWFNPLMWMAMKKSAEDLELSCDETVLLNEDDQTRKLYARLILNTASDSRGFTTCLSAEAKSLHYRLKNIVKPRKRFTGAICVGILTFFLFSMCGYVALGYNGSLGIDSIYHQQVQDFTIRNIHDYNDEFHSLYDVKEEEKFHEYLSSLIFYELTGNYTFSDSEHEIMVMMDSPQGVVSVVLYDEMIKVVPLYEDRGVKFYYCPEMDWEVIDQYIITYPSLKIELYEENRQYPHETTASLWQLQIMEDGKIMHSYEKEDMDVSGYFGYEPSYLHFEFSNKNILSCSVLVNDIEVELDENNNLVNPQIPGIYSIDVVFEEENQIIEAEYRFEMGNH